MSEFEMATLFLDFYNHALSYFELFIATLSAVLIVGYVAGPRLTSTMVAIIIGLFSMVTMVCMWHTIGAYHDGTSLALEIGRVQKTPGSGLHWMFNGNPPDNFVYFAPTLTAIMVLAYVGAVVFFFHARGQETSNTT